LDAELSHLDWDLEDLMYRVSTGSWKAYHLRAAEVSEVGRAYITPGRFRLEYWLEIGAGKGFRQSRLKLFFPVTSS